MRLAATWLAFLVLAALDPAAAGAYRYVHEVLPGERLRDIAKRYHVTARQISRRNRLKKGHLRAGRKLKIVTSVPSRTRHKVRYTVIRGDSLSKLARRVKMKRWLLRRLNARTLGKRKTLRPGQKLWVIVEGPNPSGGVAGLHQLRRGPGFLVRNPRRSWGTLLTVTRIHDVLGAYARRFRHEPKIKVMDLSKRGGGYFVPHKSHRSGRDVDIPYPLKKKYRKYHSATPKRIHPAHAWWLVKRFLETGDVTFIFMDYPLQRVLYKYAKKIGEKQAFLDEAFQYPRGAHVYRGIIRDEPGHDTHFHVRFRRPGKKKKKRSRKKARKHRRKPLAHKAARKSTHKPSTAKHGAKTLGRAPRTKAGAAKATKAKSPSTPAAKPAS